MAKLDKKTLKNLDKVNCAWVLEQISVGNIVRGIAYIVSVFGEVGKCIISTTEQIKSKMKEEEKTEEEDTETSKTKKSTKKK